MRVSGARCLSFAVILVAILCPASVLAQRGQDAALVGTVRDGSAAVIEGATVTVSSPQLIGGSRKTSTDPLGTYRFAAVTPGRYHVVVEQPGFETVSRADVDLTPGATLTLDVTLQIAAVNQAVVVERPSPVVDVRTSAGQVLIDRALLENLPLARSVSDAVNLAPGVIRDVAFGGSLKANPLSIDGTNGNEPEFGTPTVIGPNVNWIEELQIVGVGADAQYGEYSGALENAITRSGSNAFSGLVDLWTTRPSWTGNNRGTLSPQLQQRFRPVEILSRWDSDFQLGGPAVRDRLWFFAGGEVYRNAYRPASFTGVPRSPGEPKTDSSERKAIMKITAALTPALRAEGFFAHNAQHATGTNAGPLVQAEALGVLDRPETMWNGRLLWTASSTTFVEVRHGGHNMNQHTGPPEQQRAGPPGHYDQLTGVNSVNGMAFRDILSRPIAAAANITHFIGTGMRHHEIKAGVEYEHTRLRDATHTIGGVQYYDYDGRPDTAYFGGDQTYRPTHNRRTLYIQDGWTPVDRITVNAGVRAGFYAGGVPTHERAFSAHSTSPRVGIAWDVSGDHRTVVRGHYGRYHDEMVTSFYDFLDPLSQEPTIVATAVNGTFVPVSQFGSTVNASIDPDVKFSYAEEFFGAIERQLPRGIVGRVQVIRRDFDDSIGFIDPAAEWTPAPRTDPGPDGRVGTADDAGEFTVYLRADPTRSALFLTNPPAYRQYRAVQLIATKRHARNLGFQLSYTWSRTVGNYNNGFSSSAANADLSINSVFVNPNRAQNAEGRTLEDCTHELKTLWNYRVNLWGDLDVSGVARFQSGRAWARTVSGLPPQAHLLSVFVEPRASRQLPAIHRVDLRIDKTLRGVSARGRIGVFADIFNVLNQGVALNVNSGSGPNFGVPSNWLEPRSLRAGVRVMF
jgi:sulfur carrier protein ThiS